MLTTYPASGPLAHRSRAVAATNSRDLGGPLCDWHGLCSQPTIEEQAGASDMAMFKYHREQKVANPSASPPPKGSRISRLPSSSSHPLTSCVLVAQSFVATMAPHQTHHTGWHFLLATRAPARNQEQQHHPDTEPESDSSGSVEGSDSCKSHDALSPASSVTLGPMSPLSARGDSPPSTDNASAQITEDGTLRSIAQVAMSQVKSITENALVSGAWKQRRSRANELILEHKSQQEYRIISRAVVPCSMDEVSSVFSSTNSDQFNASMLELLGSEFGYGITVRSIPTEKPQSASLTVKVLSFGGAAHHSSSASVDRGSTFLDYTESDQELRTERRVLQLIKRRQHSPDDEPQSRIGDLLCGYALHEDKSTKQTVISLYGAYFMKSSVDRALRHATIHRFRKIAQVSTKWMDIIMRRRLGTQEIFDPSSASRSILELSCVGCNEAFHSIFRKRHFCNFCGCHACASCSSVQDVEARIGMIEKHRICHGCASEVNQNALAKREADNSPAKPKYHLYTSAEDTTRMRF